MDGSFEEVMLVDFEMDNFITVQVSHSVLWRVEYPSTGETAESVTLIYVRQRDVLGIVPLAEVRTMSFFSCSSICTNRSSDAVQRTHSN